MWFLLVIETQIEMRKEALLENERPRAKETEKQSVMAKMRPSAMAMERLSAMERQLRFFSVTSLALSCRSIEREMASPKQREMV